MPFKFKLKLFSILGIVISSFGIMIVIGGFLINTNMIKYSGEVPLGFLESFDVDSSCNFYIHTGFCGKILVYDSNGKFLRSWFSSAPGGGDTYLEVTKEQNICITYDKGSYQELYTPQGKRLYKIDIDLAQWENQTGYNLKPKEVWNKGRRFQVDGYVNKQIIETVPIRKTIISQPCYLNVLNVPMGFVYILSGPILVILSTLILTKITRNK